MDYQWSIQDIMNVAAEKVSIEGWQGYSWDRLDGGDSLVVGCVPDGVFSRGPRKGQPRFNKPVSGTTKKIAVSYTEMQAAAERYEKETGNCWHCKGTGEGFKGWHHETGEKRDTCPKCGGTTVAPTSCNTATDNGATDKAGDTIKGKDLQIGMKVQRVVNGEPANIPMIIFAEGPYYNNALYSDDDFLVIQQQTG